MPQRFLRPGITKSERWNAVSWQAQSLFIRILTLVDDFGRYDARIAVLQGECFALRPEVKPQQTAAFRSELQRAGLIDVYSIGGKEFLQVEQWLERARTEKSKYPSPNDPAAERSGTQRNPASIAIASTSSPSTIDQLPLHPAKSRGTREEVIAFCAEVGLPQTDADYFFDKCEGSGWKNGGNPIKDWRATIRSWKAAGYMPSQKAAKLPPSRQAEAAGKTYPGPATVKIITSEDIDAISQ